MHFLYPTGNVLLYVFFLSDTHSLTARGNKKKGSVVWFLGVELRYQIKSLQTGRKKKPVVLLGA